MVTGFSGPNGSGNSATTRLIICLDAPSGGDVTVDGRHVRDRAHLRRRRRAGKFSPGMTQRLGMAAALVIDGVMLVKRDT